MEHDKIGRIEIQRPSGTEIWNLKSGQFSIDKPTDKNRLNFWVESDIEFIQKLEDTGGNPISFEVTIPLKTMPDFNKLWCYKYPPYLEQPNKGDGYYDNFYYYEHDSLKEIEVHIKKIESDIYKIEVRGKRGDPIDFKYGEAKYKIIAKLPLKGEFKGLWDM